MGTSLAKMSGPVTAGSVGFTGKGFTKGAPGREKLWSPGPCSPHICSMPLSLLPDPSLPQRQTFHRLKGVQGRDSLVVDEVVVLLGRIVPGGPGKGGSWMSSRAQELASMGPLLSGAGGSLSRVQAEGQDPSP